MPTTLPVPSVTVGQTFTDTMWGSYIRDNINKLLNQGHRVLTVAQFTALVSPEGTKGVVAPDEVYVEVDSANGIQWHVAFESGEATYKWRFIGGPPLVSEVTNQDNTASTTYVALANAGPSLGLPRAGDYDVTIECAVVGAVSAMASYMSYDIGGTGAVDADSAETGPVTTSVAYGGRKRRKSALATSTLTAKYRVSTSNATFGKRLMTVTPVRIRHDA